MTNGFDEIGHITNEELIVRLRALVRADQTLSARLLGMTSPRPVWTTRCH
jgi:hypothetical protein